MITFSAVYLVAESRVLNEFCCCYQKSESTTKLPGRATRRKFPLFSSQFQVQLLNETATCQISTIYSVYAAKGIFVETIRPEMHDKSFSLSNRGIFSLSIVA